MADYNPRISNGSCYWQAGQKANARFIPCGNAALGHVPCCESGDNCLEQGACFDLATYVTYLAGCTDPDYQDGNCPSKGQYDNQSWTGLVYCQGDSYAWSGCLNPKPPPGADIATVFSVTEVACHCPAPTAQTLFSAAKVLASWISLPSSTGMSYMLLAGQTKNGFQSTTSSASSTAASSSSANTVINAFTTATASSTNAPSAFPSTPSDAAPASHMSTAQIAGAAAGGAIGFILLLTLFIILMQRHYRKQSEPTSTDPSLPQDKKDNLRPDSKVYTDDIVNGTDSQQPYGGLPSPSYKSELPADSVSSPSFRSPSTRFSEFDSARSEMEGSPAIGVGTAVPGGNIEQDRGVKVAGRKETYYELSA